MNGVAPNLLAAGSQTVPKMPQPSALNHGAACWVVEMAIRTRITSTSRPAARASHWKLRSARPRWPIRPPAGTLPGAA